MSVSLQVVFHYSLMPLESQTWSVVQAEGEAPSPRDKLSSAVIGKDIYVFGGFGPQAEDDVEVSKTKEEKSGF